MKFTDIMYLILSIAAGLFGAIGLGVVLTNIAIPDDNLIIWNNGVFFGFSFVAFAAEIALMMFAILKLIECEIICLVQKSRNKADELNEKINKKFEIEGKDDWKKEVKKFIVIFVVFNTLLCYFIYADNTIFSETDIVKKSVINPVGTTYNYSDVLGYDVDDDGINNAMLVLHMKNGGTIKVGGSDNMGGTGNNYDKTDFDYLVRIGEILQDLKVEKTVKCSPDDFAYYQEQKTNLDILMK